MANSLNTHQGTLTAGEATEIEHGRDVREVSVTHFGNVTAPIFVRFDGTPAAVLEDGNGWVLPGESKTFPRVPTADLTDGATVSIICDEPAAFGIEFP